MIRSSTTWNFTPALHPGLFPQDTEPPYVSSMVSEQWLNLSKCPFLICKWRLVQTKRNNRDEASGRAPDTQEQFTERYLLPLSRLFAILLSLKCKTSHFPFSDLSLFFYFCHFAISWAALAAYGGSQARGLIGAVATGLRQSHSNVGSEPSLQPTPQLLATPDPYPTEQGQGSNPQPHGS